MTVSKIPSWSVSIASWGHPSDPRSFSGYAKSLSSALRDHGFLGSEYNLKSLRLSDALFGAVSISRVLPFPRLTISRSWMWSERGGAAIRERIISAKAANQDKRPTLEIGTLVEPTFDLAPYFHLTDMTVAQARRAGQFDLAVMNERQMRWIEERQSQILQASSHVFALSDWTADSLRTDCGLSSDRVTVVHAGSNLYLPPGGGSVAKRPEVLFVGIDWERKGGRELVEAFRLVRQRLPAATLRIIGCSPSLPRDLLANGIIVEGYLSRSDPVAFARLCDAYRSASCFCLPSRFDPFPNAIVEAMSVGLPCISVDSGSRREAIEHGVTGLLTEPGDIDGLAEAMLLILGDPTKAAEMAAKAQEHASQKFTWESVVARIGGVVSAHLSQKSPGSTFL